MRGTMGRMSIPDYMIEFHRNAARQAPGSDDSTRRALSLVPGVDMVRRVLDLGCGTGAQSLVLAQETGATITAVDILPEFLEELEARARAAGVADRIATLEASMIDLDLPPEHYDLLWSEGSAYTVGFEAGLRYWKRFLAPGGALVVSELCWLTDDRPPEIEEYWAEGYPGIGTVEEKLAEAARAGYTCIEHFVLPPEAWTDGYYTPIRERSEAFSEAHGRDPEIDAFLDSGLDEAAMYDRFGEYYSYVFFVLRAG